MKKLLSLLLTFTMVFLLTACGSSSKTPDDPTKDTMKADVQEYIAQVVDNAAEISYFSLEDAGVNEDSGKFEALCVTTYQNNTTKYVDEFSLTYSVNEDAWELDKISIVADYEGKSNTSLDGSDVGTETSGGAAQAESANASSEMSDELYDFTFTLDGVVYKLPFAYSDLTSNGWALSNTGVTEEDEISAMSTLPVYMVKNGNKIYVDVMNGSGNAKTIKDCKIGGIEVYMNYLINADSFTIAKGISLLSSVDEITGAFGDPNSTNEHEDYTSLSYEKEYQSDVKFYVYPDSPKNNNIEMRNYVIEADDATETSKEVPEYLSAYTAPTELGDDLTVPVIEIEGEMYSLPAPVSIFIDNGWKIVQKSNGVGSGNTDSITVERNDKKLSLYIKNYAKYQTIPENCAVYSISLYDSENIDITLPGNITFDTKMSDAKAYITDDFSYYKASSYYSYSYDDSSYNISISANFDLSSEKLDSIRMSRREWNY